MLYQEKSGNPASDGLGEFKPTVISFPTLISEITKIHSDHFLSTRDVGHFVKKKPELRRTNVEL
jgi:hypothetical protein